MGLQCDGCATHCLGYAKIWLELVALKGVSYVESGAPSITCSKDRQDLSPSLLVSLATLSFSCRVLELPLPPFLDLPLSRSLPVFRHLHRLLPPRPSSGPCSSSLELRPAPLPLPRNRLGCFDYVRTLSAVRLFVLGRLVRGRRHIASRRPSGVVLHQHLPCRLVSRFVESVRANRRPARLLPPCAVAVHPYFVWRRHQMW